VNARATNVFTGAVIAVLVMLSVILTAAVLFPHITGAQIAGIMAAGIAGALVITLLTLAQRPGSPDAEADVPAALRTTWRMPPLAQLPKGTLSPLSRIWLVVLRGYLVVAAGLVLLRIVQLALGG
jgi:hypothetical protein